MTVSKYQDDYYYFSGKTSEISRSLAFAGLAVVWIFKVEKDGNLQIAVELVRAAMWIVTMLLLDLLQYFYLTVVWLIVSYIFERKYGHDNPVPGHSPWLPRVGEFIFFAKIVCLGVGYWHIGSYLLGRLRLI